MLPTTRRADPFTSRFVRSSICRIFLRISRGIIETGKAIYRIAKKLKNYRE
jgi:hypothetical protein